LVWSQQPFPAVCPQPADTVCHPPSVWRGSCGTLEQSTLREGCLLCSTPARTVGEAHLTWNATASAASKGRFPLLPTLLSGPLAPSTEPVSRRAPAWYRAHLPKNLVSLGWNTYTTVAALGQLSFFLLINTFIFVIEFYLMFFFWAVSAAVSDPVFLGPCSSSPVVLSHIFF